MAVLAVLFLFTLYTEKIAVRIFSMFPGKWYSPSKEYPKPQKNTAPPAAFCGFLREGTRRTRALAHSLAAAREPQACAKAQGERGRLRTHSPPPASRRRARRHKANEGACTLTRRRPRAVRRARRHKAPHASENEKRGLQKNERHGKNSGNG